jgi:hypothetical protein
MASTYLIVTRNIHVTSMPFLTDELIACLETLYEILDYLEVIRIAFEKEETDFIPPPSYEFDPLQTIGKY